MRLPMLFGWCFLVLGWFYNWKEVKAGQCPAYSPFVVKQGYRLYGHVIYSLYAEKEVLCRLKCNINERCLTFNYDAATEFCELNDADHEKDLQKAQGFIYVDVKKKKKSEVPSTSPTPTTSTSPTPTTSTSPTPTTPTSPVFCVQPKSGNCNPNNDVNTWDNALIFKSVNKDCSADYMQFIFDSSGVIYHECSGKIVCPQGDEPEKEHKLLLKDKCPKEVSTHRRIELNNLQNIKNDFCVHPMDGKVKDNVFLIYHPRCGEERLSLDFFKSVQCGHKDVAIGIQNKSSIPDDYITASKNRDNAKKARLNGPSSWTMNCRDNSSCNGHWLQVNVGKIAKITRIATQSGYLKKIDSPSGEILKRTEEKYRLSYSKDGSRFTDYNNSQVFIGNEEWNTTDYKVLTPAIAARYVRVYPMKDDDKSGFVTLRMELYECKEDEGKCTYALGMQSRNIKGNQLSASSPYSPSNARLGNTNAWMPRNDDKRPWLQIDLYPVENIAAIDTQGLGKDNWVEEYRLEYQSTSIKPLLNYTENREPKTFIGNFDHENITRNVLNPVISTKIVRIVPTIWHVRIAMRVELYRKRPNCPADSDNSRCLEALGMKNRTISDNQLSASSYDYHDYPTNARLEGPSGWEPHPAEKPWLQIDLRQVKKINGIATQGQRFINKTTKYWVTQYRLQYRNASTAALNDYKVDVDPEKFTGNSDCNSIVYNAIDPAIIAQIVRIVPTAWNGHIAMRVELYGCPYKGAYDGSK